MANNNNDVEPVLDRRPEARGYKVEQLLAEAKLGRLRIPPFQRPLRWRSKNVIELFDSIRRGFPIGELLLSRSPAPAGIVNFGPVAIESSEHPSALWVVDGQQRVTAMVAALLRQDPFPRRDYWAIWYDLENEKFEILTKKEVNPAWIPLRVLSDSVLQLKWLRNWVYADGNELLVNRVLDLGKAIREYEIPAYIVEGANQRTLRLIFTRVNTGGVEMRESEIFEALYGVEGDKPIRSAVARLADLGFGMLDEDLFLRCLRATCNPIPEDHVTLETELPSDSIRRTEAALRRSIQTITTWAGIPIFKLMPYRLPLYILSALYDHFPNANSRTDRLAAKWIWRGAISGKHENSSDARVSELGNIVRSADSAEFAISKLIEDLGDFNDWSSLANNPLRKIKEKISLNSAASKVFILGLIAANPRRCDSKQLSLFEFEDLEAEFEETNGVSSNLGEINERIYMALMGTDKLGSDIVIRLSGMVPNRQISDEEFDLDSLLLSRSILENVSSGNLEGFRSARTAILATHLRNFVNDRVGDRIEIRPSISSITSSVPLG